MEDFFEAIKKYKTVCKVANSSKKAIAAVNKIVNYGKILYLTHKNDIIPQLTLIYCEYFFEKMICEPDWLLLTGK